MTAGIDLLVVDEAQRLRRPPGHPGEPGYRAVAPIAALGRHVLLLSATPLEDDAHGFFRLLQLLRPEEFPEGTGRRGAARVRRAAAAVHQLDAPRRHRRPAAARARRDRRSARRAAQRTLTAPARRARCRRASRRERLRHDPVAARRALDRIRRALASGAALKAVLGPDETELRQQAEAMDRTDPRLEWLLTQAKRWRRANEKTLVFVAHRETLEMLRDALSARAQLASGVFHEELSAARRDTEVARFRADDGPSILVSTEAGGEGRNFEFCHRLVLYDLPWKPSDGGAAHRATGSHRPPHPGRNRLFPSGIRHRRRRRAAVRAARALPRADGRSRAAARRTSSARWRRSRSIRSASLSDAQIEQLIAAAQAARTRIHEAAYQQLHRDPYRAELGPAILARVPPGLDALMEQVVVNAASRLGFRVEQVRGRRAYAIEFGNEALVDSLPGVPGGSSFVGSFDREYAVEDESHRLLRVGPRARRRRCSRISRRMRRGASRGSSCASPVRAARGLVAICKDGPQFDVVGASTRTGSARPEWAEAFRRRPLRCLEDEGGETPPRTTGPRSWADSHQSSGSRRPHAVAGVVVRSK